MKFRSRKFSSGTELRPGVLSNPAGESFSRLVLPWSPLNYDNLWFLLLSDFDKINVSPPSGLVSGGLVFYSWQIWWKYFHNFRRNVQCRAVSCPPAGLKLRAQIWLFLRIISQCQLSRGRSIRSGCSICWVSWTKQIEMRELQTDSGCQCRMSSSHSDVQIPQRLQLDRHLQVHKTFRQTKSEISLQDWLHYCGSLWAMAIL